MNLVGRGVERRRLTAALADPDTGLVIVRGRSGAGKTVLVEAVLSDLAGRGTIVGRGKYAEGDATSGFAPILQALAQAASGALDLLYDPAAGAESLSKALGAQLSLLESAGFGPIDVLKSVGRIPALPLQGGEGKARIIDAIARLIHWLYGFGTPVVLFIDDWQRAPQDAHPLATIATRDRSLRLCTVIFAERSDNDESPGPGRAHTEVIALGPLNPVDQIALLGDAIGDRAAGAAIDAWLAGSSSGLPFDLSEAARALLERSAIRTQDGTWIVDHVAAASIDRHDVTNTVLARARSLPPDILEIGVAFALWGDQVPLVHVVEATGCAPDHIEQAALRLQREGIVRVAGMVVVFVHDRLRVGLLAASPVTKTAMAARMAERLRGMDDRPSLLRPALKFRMAAGLTDAAPSLWRDHFSTEAAMARNTADNATANSFAEAAWELRVRERGIDPAADALILREASLAAAARRDIAVLRGRIEEMVSLARDDDQISDAYQTAIIAACIAADLELAWKWSLEGIGRMGTRLPARARKIDLVVAAIQWRLGQLLPRPRPPANHTVETVDPLRRITNFAAIVAYGREPAMMLLISLRSSTRARQLGYHSAFYDSVDIAIHAAFGNYRKAAELGASIARSVLPDTFGRAATLYRALYLGLIWAVPLHIFRDGLTKVYDLAIAECDLVYAQQAVRNFARIAWRIEPTLGGVLVILKDSMEKAEQFGDAVALQGMRALVDTIGILQDPRGFTQADEPWTRLGIIAGMSAPIMWLEVLALRGDWAGALALTRKFDEFRADVSSHPGGVIWRFFENLARLKLGMPMRRGDLRYIRRAANLNPGDHQRKLLILESELLRQKGAAERCLNAYANAAEVASSGASRLEAGIAAECAAAAARSFGKLDVADRYEALAMDIWNAWGAFAKTGGRAISAREDSASVVPLIAEAELKAARANRSERAKSRFVAEVGHELRTPLQSIQSMLDLASEAPSEVSMSELREVFGSLKTVVDDLTDLAALGGGAPLNLKPVDISGLVDSEAQMAAAMARRKGIAFVADLQTPSLIVKIDNARVRQVVRNLLSNAVKYTEKGEIVLRLATASRGNRSFGVSITVEDSGPGFADTQLVRLFEPFDRGERDDGGGLGLGLTLSRRIAERMGGALEAANRAQGGASFTFTFEVETAEVMPAPPDSTARLRIMLVEDVELNRRMLATMLRQAGHHVSEAEDGAAALTLHQGGYFDLILLDVGLPDIDGFHIMETMRRSPGGSSAQIIVLTASTAPDLAERARSLGAVRILHKPISIDELRSAIQSVFSLPPQSNSYPAAAFEAELQEFARQARQEILARGHALIDRQWNSETLAREAHRLAGLAAQFGATTIAALADRVEADARSGAVELAEFSEFRRALEDLAAASAERPTAD